jgi:hypothetical protein
MPDGRRSCDDPSVTDRIGWEHLGTFARHQIEVARRDPRVERGRGAMVADFFAAMEEAERWREVTTWGLRELEQAVAHEEARLGLSRTDPDLSPENREILQNAWERAEMARAELANEYPYVHAVTLISMHGALDALVEELVPGAQQIIAGSIFEAARERVESTGDASWKDIPEDRRSVVREAIVRTIADLLPQNPAKPWGSGPQRYELVLERANLHTPPQRPIPADLDEALTELGAIRHVLVHRGGRVDQRALADAPTLKYADGEFVRIGRADYRRYSAAVRAYGIDITQRVLGPMARSDLASWRENHYINA